MNRCVKDLKDLICLSRLTLNDHETINPNLNKNTLKNSKDFKKSFDNKYNDSQIEELLLKLDKNKISEILRINNKNLEKICRWSKDKKNLCSFIHFWCSELNIDSKQLALQTQLNNLFTQIIPFFKSTLPFPAHQFISCDLTINLSHLVHKVLYEFEDLSNKTLKENIVLNHLLILISENKMKLKSFFSKFSHNSTNKHFNKVIRVIKMFFVVGLCQGIMKLHQKIRIKKIRQRSKPPPPSSSSSSSSDEKIEKHSKICKKRKKVKGYKNRMKFLDDFSSSSFSISFSNSSFSSSSLETRKGFENINFKRCLEAIKMNYPEVVEIILNFDPFLVEEVDSSGKSLLFYSVLSNRPDNLRIIIEIWKNQEKKDENFLNKADITGNTALHYAAKLNHLKCLRILLEEEDVEIDVENHLYEGASPLHLALIQGEFGAVDMLLMYGADKEKRMGGRTSLQVLTSFAPSNKIANLFRKN